MPTIDDLLLPKALAQHGLVTLGDVLAEGGRAHHAEARLRSGRWQRVDNGVYRLAGHPVTQRTALLAPILSAGGTTMASHLSAAVMHGMPGFRAPIPELSVQRGRKFRRPSIRVHTSTDLDRCARVFVDGIPTTDVARTILDLGRYVGDRRLLRTIEWARRGELADWTSLLRTLRRHARRGRPGVARLRRVIAANMDRAEVTDSDLEFLALTLLLEAGLPEPVVHHRVLDGGRFVAEVDLAYPDLRIAIELDGSIHLHADVRERDLPRQNDLVLLGWIVLRFTWDRLIRRPELVVAEVRDARRRAALHIAV